MSVFESRAERRFREALGQEEGTDWLLILAIACGAVWLPILASLVINLIR